MPAPPAKAPPLPAPPAGAPPLPAPPSVPNPNDKLQPLIDKGVDKVKGWFKPNPNTTPKETTEEPTGETAEETTKEPGFLSSAWTKVKNMVANGAALVDTATSSPEEIEKRKNQAVAQAGAAAGKTILGGIGSFFKGMAPYAVPGILGYLALRAAGTEGGTAALGGLAAGAIGGSLWKDPSNKDQVDSIKKWFDSDPAPAKNSDVALNNVRTEAQDAVADTTNTAISASKQLNSPLPRYTV